MRRIQADGAALAVAVGYRDACAARAIPSSCRPIVFRLQEVGRQAQASVLAARNFVRNYPTLSAANAINAAQDAVNFFKSTQSSLGVQ